MIKSVQPFPRSAPPMALPESFSEIRDGLVMKQTVPFTLAIDWGGSKYDIHCLLPPFMDEAILFTLLLSPLGL